MKIYKLSFTLFCIIITIHYRSFGQEAGLPILFNDSWGFHRGDLPKDTNLNFGSLWKPVQIPHDWSIHEPFSNRWASSTAYLPGGIEWLKRNLLLKKNGPSGRYIVLPDCWDWKVAASRAMKAINQIPGARCMENW